MERQGPRPRALAMVLTTAVPTAPAVDLSWHAPPSCPDESMARAAIVDRLGEQRASEVHAVATVSALDDQWQVDVELRTAEGTATRTLRASSCAEALTATAVVLAIAVDSTWASSERPSVEGVPPPPDEGVQTEPAATEQAPAEPEPAPPEPPLPEPPPPEPAERLASVPVDAPIAPAVAPRSRWLLAGIRGGLDYGALPSPAGHLAASVGLGGQRWAIEAGALHRIRTETSAGLSVPAGGRFRMTAGQLRASLRLDRGALVLPLSAGLEVGAIWARGTGQVRPIPVRRSWAAATAGVGIGWAPVEALALVLGLDGVVPLLRPTFTLDDSIEVLTVGPAALRAWLGVVGRFSLKESASTGKSR